jgi:Tol biopolymer transport system component
MSAVLDDRLRQRLARAADYGAEVARPPAPAAIRRRGRMRRWRRAAVAAATACALTGGVVLAGTDGLPEPAGPAARPIGTAPASFVAVVGGRVAVVSTASGKVVRYLSEAPTGDGQFFFALSEDRDTVWFSDVAVCGHSGIYRVPYRGGAAVRVDRSANAEALTVSHDGSKLVYHPLGCHGGGPSPAFAVLDLRTGKTRMWAYSQRGEVLGAMTWSPDGRHLAYIEFFGNGTRRTRAWLLDTTGPGTSLAASRPLPPPDKGCEIRGLAWQPGTGRLAISEACPNSNQLVFVNRPGGKVLSRPLRVDQSFAGGHDFDPSGRHLLYTTGAPGAPYSARTTWRWDGTRAVEIGRGYGKPMW